MALLETNQLTVTYGGVTANHEVSLTVEEGAFVGLIGPNGAGKTTLVDAVTGFTKPSGGWVRFAGRDITGLTPHARAKLGLSRTFQSVELFDDLRVIDNLLVAAETRHWWSPLADVVAPERARGVEIEQALEALGIGELADRYPPMLSHGQRKLVGAARALARHPSLLVLDEPAAGLDTTESVTLGKQLRGLLDEGVSVLLIDHDMGLVLNVCDYVYVLDFGRIIAAGTPAEIRSDPAVIAAYLGARHQAPNGDHA